MKYNLWTAILIILNVTAGAQTRYFEFRQPFDMTTTSFIVATSDTSVINEVLLDLTLPVDQRRFISGNVISGHGGFNHDGTDWHTWHFIPNEWQLSVSNVEFCDGIASFIGSHPDLIAGETIYFCPWDSYPFQEVENPALSIEEVNADNQVSVFPNPATSTVYFSWQGSGPLSVEVYNTLGQSMLSARISKQNNGLDITPLNVGLYIVQLSYGNKKSIKKLIVEH